MVIANPFSPSHVADVGPGPDYIDYGPDDVVRPGPDYDAGPDGDNKKDVKYGEPDLKQGYRHINEIIPKKPKLIKIQKNMFNNKLSPLQRQQQKQNNQLMEEYKQSMIEYRQKQKENFDNTINKGGSYILTRLQNYANQYDKIDLKNCKGSFTYRTTNTRNFDFNLNLKTIDDVLLTSAMLISPNIINKNKLPPNYKKTYELLIAANCMYDYSFIIKFKDILKDWMPETKTYVDEKEVFNDEKDEWETVYENRVVPKLSKDSPLHEINGSYGNIQLYGRYYTKIFRNIKLKNVKYPNLENYNIIKYDVKEYCVPSYLNDALLNKEYKQIKNDLEQNKTPTYEELTVILNKINYNLNVWIIDGEQLQEQTEHKKTLNIMIHEEHMYVLKKKFNKNNLKSVYCKTNEEFKNIKCEYYKDRVKINNNIKYHDAPLNISKLLNMGGYYTNKNIDFYYECNIRPTFYVDNCIEGKTTLDINKCYINILYNKNYSYPTCDGTEQTTIYDNTYEIINTGFYFCILNTYNEIHKALFKKECWVMGYLIKELNLDVTILYQHIPAEGFSFSDEQIDELKKYKSRDIRNYTGILAKYTTQKTTTIHTTSQQEKKAYESKYPNSYIVNDEIEIVYNHYRQKTGVYSYMGIVSYSKYQLYRIYEVLQDMYSYVGIYKIKTDSMQIDEDISDDDIIEINKRLEQYNISVKKEDKQPINYIDTIDEPIPRPTIEEQKTYTRERQILPLLKNKKSFFLSGRAGYGKTHKINNLIIPYLNKHKMKYIHAAPTTHICDLFNINTLHSYLNNDQSKIDEIFKDIDYLIIDECGLIPEHFIIVLEHIKKLGVNIICVGDINQCSYSVINIMDRQTMINICDGIIYNVVWTEHARYNKEYDTFLNKLLKFNVIDDKCIQHIKSYFTINSYKTKDTNDIKLTYTNNMKSLVNATSTIFKMQGHTINEKYSIYETTHMPMKVLYTALSRCTDPKLITLFY